MPSPKKPSREAARANLKPLSPPSSQEPQLGPVVAEGEKYGIVRALRAAARGYLEEELSEDLCRLHLQPTIRAEALLRPAGDHFECLVCGKRLEFETGVSLRYSVHLLGKPHPPTYVARLCLPCLRGGPQKALNLLQGQILIRCTNRDATWTLGFTWWQVEDQITVYKLLRESMPRVPWWPASEQALKRLDSRATREATQRQKQWLLDMTTVTCGNCDYPLLENPSKAAGFYNGQKKSPRFSEHVSHCPGCGQWLSRAGGVVRKSA